MTVCKRCRVTGRVQGVWFRATTQQRAAQLGLVGYARNLVDGTVEVLACGEEGQVDLLSEWLWLGSPGSKVDQVVCELADEIPPTTFTTQ